MLTLYSREWSSEEGEGGREGREGREEREEKGEREKREERERERERGERQRENIIIFKSDLHFYNNYNLSDSVHTVYPIHHTCIILIYMYVIL